MAPFVPDLFNNPALALNAGPRVVEIGTSRFFVGAAGVTIKRYLSVEAFTLDHRQYLAAM
jgi:hypothetical protein